MNAHKPIITNHQIQPTGESTFLKIQRQDDQFVLFGEPTAGTTHRVLCPAAEGIDRALELGSEALRVGTGITDIRVSRRVNLHKMLGLLNVDSPEAGEPDPGEWSAEAREAAEEIGIDIDDWKSVHDQIHDIRTPEDHALIPRWLRINGDRAFVVTGPELASVGLFREEADWNRVGTTVDLLSWSFYRESGAPITWGGRATLGWCGPKLWSFSRVGDVSPEEWVFPAPPTGLVAQELAGWILHLDWELPYLVSVIGLPGLTEHDRRALLKSGSGWVEGDRVESHSSAELDRSVVAHICELHPVLHDAVEGLRDPQSERGRLIYAWVRQITHGPMQSGSWDQVHAAMLGSIDPPADDPRAPTMQERWARTVEQAAGVVREATGQPQLAPSITIPAGVPSAVEGANSRLTAAQLRDAIEMEEHNATLIDAARAQLGAQPGERKLMAKLKRLVEQRPEDKDLEADLWSAYWTIQDWDSSGAEAGHRAHLDSLRQELGRAEEAESLAVEQGWPRTWPPHLLPVWLQHGGTVESAREWADAGWSPAEILTSTRLTGTWNPEFHPRLTLTNPPLKNPKE